MLFVAGVSLSAIHIHELGSIHDGPKLLQAHDTCPICAVKIAGLFDEPDSHIDTLPFEAPAFEMSGDPLIDRFRLPGEARAPPFSIL